MSFEFLNINYQLQSVVVHRGHLPSSGHYLAYIKRESDWLVFDDEDVEILSDYQTMTDVHKTDLEQDSYLLVYKQTDLQTDLINI